MPRLKVSKLPKGNSVFYKKNQIHSHSESGGLTRTDIVLSQLTVPIEIRPYGMIMANKNYAKEKLCFFYLLELTGSGFNTSQPKMDWIFVFAFVGCKVLTQSRI